MKLVSGREAIRVINPGEVVGVKLHPRPWLVCEHDKGVVMSTSHLKNYFQIPRDISVTVDEQLGRVTASEDCSGVRNLQQGLNDRSLQGIARVFFGVAMGSENDRMRVYSVLNPSQNGSGFSLPAVSHPSSVYHIAIGAIKEVTCFTDAPRDIDRDLLYQALMR